MSSQETKIDSEWMNNASLQTLFDLLETEGGEARVAGGAVRNELMGKPISDIDLSTTHLPQKVVELLETAGHKGVPTGIEHGTITAVIDGNAFEVTTLREDIETDGRHAVVRFGTDWEADAFRRDLTVNGLFCDRRGRIYDFVGGVKDTKSSTIRFIGDAEQRIKEDSLRILRFFRFFAWYGGGRPEASGLKACSKHKELMRNLSAERVWAELKKLLAAHDPGRALLWMRTTGVLSLILPETEKWGIDSMPGLIAAEQENGWTNDPMLRLMAMVRPSAEIADDLADRLSMSNADRQTLLDSAGSNLPKPDASPDELERQLYYAEATAVVNAMKLEVVHCYNREEGDDSDRYVALIRHAMQWQKPEFPVKGSDLLERGYEAGPNVGEILKELESVWVESQFRVNKSELLERLTAT